MPNSTWFDRAARAVAVLRGLMLVLFSVFLVLAPEKSMVGSSAEPARSLALMISSRTILLGIALVVLAITRRRAGLGWVLCADALLQLFDTGMALAMHKGVLAVAPLALGALDVWAGLFLLRASRARLASPAD